jgi:uncharacterized membrane protein
VFPVHWALDGQPNGFMWKSPLTLAWVLLVAMLGFPLELLGVLRFFR